MKKVVLLDSLAVTVIEHVAALSASHVAVDLEAASASLAILEASVNKSAQNFTMGQAVPTTVTAMPQIPWAVTL